LQRSGTDPHGRSCSNRPAATNSGGDPPERTISFALDESLDDRLALRGTPADPPLAGRLEFRLATQIDVRRQTNVRIITACLMAFPIRF
jgi:hypothetical protein